MDKFIFEFAGWLFGGLALAGLLWPFYDKHLDKKANKKAAEYRKANAAYYEHVAKLAGVDVGLVG